MSGPRDMMCAHIIAWRDNPVRHRLGGTPCVKGGRRWPPCSNFAATAATPSPTTRSRASRGRRRERRMQYDDRPRRSSGTQASDRTQSDRLRPGATAPSCPRCCSRRRRARHCALRLPSPPSIARPRSQKGREWLEHANVWTRRIYDHRRTRPEDSPTVKVAY